MFPAVWTGTRSVDKRQNGAYQIIARQFQKAVQPDGFVIQRFFIPWEDFDWLKGIWLFGEGKRFVLPAARAGRRSFLPGGAGQIPANKHYWP